MPRGSSEPLVVAMTVVARSHSWGERTRLFVDCQLYPQQESNLYLRFRRAMLCPLSYGGMNRRASLARKPVDLPM